MKKIEREFPQKQHIEFGTLVAIPIPWEHSGSGCVEWRLIGWTVEDDAEVKLPVLDDGYGDGGAWGSDYAVRTADNWRFPDGELCDDENLIAAFREADGVMKKIERELRRSFPQAVTERTGRSHFKLLLPNGSTVITSSSPSCPFWLHNVRSDVRKKMRGER